MFQFFPDPLIFNTLLEIVLLELHAVFHQQLWSFEKQE